MSLPLKPQWGIVLDDLGSMDTYNDRAEAEAAYEAADGACPLVRIDCTVLWPGVRRG